MKKISIIVGFLLILSLVLSAGCISGDDTKGKGGFGEDSLDLLIDTEGRTLFDSNEEFIITMAIENFGPFDVEAVETKLVGFDGITHQDVGVSLSTEITMAVLLDRPRPDLDMPGGTATYDWAVTAPKIAETSPDRDVTLTGEVYYRTQSLGVQRVVVVDHDYEVQMLARGEVIPVNPATEALNGPVSLDVSVPEPYVSTTGTNPWFRVKIVLANDGSGNLYSRTLDPGNKDMDYLETLTLTVPVGLTVDLDNCDFNVTYTDPATQETVAADSAVEKELFIDETSPNSRKAKLRMMEGGLSRDVGCRLKVDTAAMSGYQTYELYAESEYTYLQDMVRPLTIIGQPE